MNATSSSLLAGPVNLLCAYFLMLPSCDIWPSLTLTGCVSCFSPGRGLSARSAPRQVCRLPTSRDSGDRRQEAAGKKKLYLVMGIF